jgi:hypothetical protein
MSLEIQGVYKQTYLCMYKYIYICIYVCIYIPIYMYIYMYVNTYICIYRYNPVTDPPNLPLKIQVITPLVTCPVCAGNQIYDLYEI